jgi:hypothetical protein
MPALVQGNFVAGLASGLGTGAIIIALVAIVGGYAISGRGSGWVRRVSRSAMTALVLALVVAAFIAPAEPGTTPVEPMGAYTLLTFLVLCGLLAAPFRTFPRKMRATSHGSKERQAQQRPKGIECDGARSYAQSHRRSLKGKTMRIGIGLPQAGPLGTRENIIHFTREPSRSRITSAARSASRPNSATAAGGRRGARGAGPLPSGAVSFPAWPSAGAAAPRPSSRTVLMLPL